MSEDRIEVINWVIRSCVERVVSWCAVWIGVGGCAEGQSLPASRDEAVAGPFILYIVT